MGLFDALSGAASKKAARQNQIAIDNALASGTGSLNTGADRATGYLGVNNGGNAMDALGAGYGQARSDVAGQYGQTQGYLGRLGEQYAPMAQQGSKAYSAYNDAIGANGAAGSEAAQSAFRAAPGYQYAQDQALEAVQRSAAARGGLAGGNTTSDILKTATGLADQGWNSYINNLKGGSDYYTTALAGQGQGLSAQAQASQNQGAALGALGTGLGTGQAGLYGQGATTQTALGQNLANLQLGGANAMVSNNNNLAQAQNQASANFIDLGKSVIGGFGSFASNGGTISKLANVFS